MNRRLFMTTTLLARVVAEIIANAIPDAFAQHSPAGARVRFDLDSDFSVGEREAFLNLATEVLAVVGDMRKLTPPRP
jgi:hypothetical protein